MKTVTIVLMLAAMATMAFVSIPTTSAQSSNPCLSCHAGLSPTRFQYLDIVEGDPGNSIPNSLQVGQTATVSVVVQNSLQNAAIYTDLSGVTLTLGSANGHFQVSNPTASIGTLAPGSATATWQITAISAGTDTLTISASATNSHQGLSFSDSYSPSPTITITTPTPTTYTVSVSVVDSASTTPVSGATVTLNGSPQTTDASGVVSFTVASGVYPMTISMTGYSTTSETVSITGTMTLSRSLTASPPPATNHSVTITLKDSSTSQPITGATITLAGTTAITDSTGSTTFSTPTGSYTLSISKSGYTTTTETLTVSADVNIARSLTPTTITPPTQTPTTYDLTITVLDSSNSPISGATVSVGGASTQTGPEGVATLSLPAATYTVTVSKQGYSQRTQTLTLSGNTTLTVRLDAPVSGHEADNEVYHHMRYHHHHAESNEEYEEED